MLIKALGLSLVVTGNFSLASANTLAPSATPTERIASDDNIRLWQLTSEHVCTRVVDQLVAYGTSIGLDNSVSRVYALESTQQLLSGIRNGSRREFIEMSTLAFHRQIQPKPEHTYLNLAGILGTALELQSPVILGFNVNDLRFLPQVQVGTNVVMLVGSLDGLTSARAKSVVGIAKKLQIKLSVIWMGKEDKNLGGSNDQEALAYLAAVTGGKFVDFGGQANPCAKIL